MRGFINEISVYIKYTEVTKRFQGETIETDFIIHLLYNCISGLEGYPLRYP